MKRLDHVLWRCDGATREGASLVRNSDLPSMQTTINRLRLSLSSFLSSSVTLHNNRSASISTMSGESGVLWFPETRPER